MDRAWEYNGPDFDRKAMWLRLGRLGYLTRTFYQWPEELQEAASET